VSDILKQRDKNVYSAATANAKHAIRQYVFKRFLRCRKFERVVTESLHIAKARVAHHNATTKIWSIISRHTPFAATTLETSRFVTVRKIFWTI